ncbi:hypothetical protein K440DRAFT_641091 [Wilcoxina mikolae CBS 423.85]|nr:hypothetical protein K440DRAFT_641091 [Wilcoxina mikolae CBS 423.85]
MVRLSNLVRNLPDKAADIVHFWIDTIGCPPDASQQHSAQQLAISMMWQTYRNVCAVLVLDSWLQSQEMDIFYDADVLIEIVCSAWNSRLWTLQEGALTDILFFQFSNGAYNIDEGIDRLKNPYDLAVDISLRTLINQRVFEFRGFRGESTPIANNIERKIEALAFTLSFRSTSVVSDETLCLATLFGLDIMEVLQTSPKPPDLTMIQFWSMLSSVPAQFIFFQWPRLETESYLWAPQTLLRNRGTELSMRYYKQDKTMGQPTAGGLLVQFPGITFAAGTKPIGPQFHVRDEDGRWYLFRILCIAGLYPLRPGFDDDHIADLNDIAAGAQYGEYWDFDGRLDITIATTKGSNQHCPSLMTLRI